MSRTASPPHGHGRRTSTARRTTRAHTPPRRVSGPAAPRTAAATAAAVAHSLPRRVPAHAARPPLVGLGFQRVRSIPDSGFLDTLLRSRAWIWIIGVLLGGIVAMQVSLLKLNAGIGRAIESSSTLQRQNAALESRIARLSSGERIRLAAQDAGMVLPDSGSIAFVTVRPGDARRAAARMQEPTSAARALMDNGGIVPGSLMTTAPVDPVAGAETTEPVSTTPAATPVETTTEPAAEPVQPVTTETTAAPETAPTGGAVVGEG